MAIPPETRLLRRNTHTDHHLVLRQVNDQRREAPGHAQAVKYQSDRERGNDLKCHRWQLLLPGSQCRYRWCRDSGVLLAHEPFGARAISQTSYGQRGPAGRQDSGSHHGRHAPLFRPIRRTLVRVLGHNLFARQDEVGIGCAGDRKECQKRNECKNLHCLLIVPDYGQNRLQPAQFWDNSAKYQGVQIS